MRVATGANMASAAVNLPKRYGPPDSAVRSPQMVSRRRRSAATASKSTFPGCEARRFIGAADAQRAQSRHAFRRKRHAPGRVRAASDGQMPLAGYLSLRYSMMAMVSGTTASPSISTGTLPVGDLRRMVSLPALAAELHQFLVERDAEMLEDEPGPQRPARIVAVGKDQFHRVIPNAGPRSGRVGRATCSAGTRPWRDVREAPAQRFTACGRCGRRCAWRAP